MRQISTAAFEKIADFEILLRRFVRWQLMSRYGRSWLTEIGDDLFELVQKRIQSEKKQGVYWAKSSELSFLSLSELIELIFSRLWKASAGTVLKTDYGLKRVLQQTIIPLRNKVAHFRAVDSSDLHLLRYASELRAALLDYYSDQERVALYLSSDPELLEEQIDFEIEREIRTSLDKQGLGYFWIEYGKFEGIRAKNILTGFGIYDHNLFLELNFMERTVPSTCLDTWFESNKYLVSSIVVDRSKVRIFFPCAVSETDTKKLINSLHKQFGNSCLNQTDRFDEIQSEYIIDTRMEEPVGLAF